MYVTTVHRRTLTAATVLVAAWFTLAVPGAVAAPKPEPQPAGVTGCPLDVHEFTARLRGAGFTAQAANNAAQLTNRECLKELTRRTAAPFTRHQARGHLAMGPCAGLDATLRDLESLTRTVAGRSYRQDGLYSAGSALTRDLSVQHCIPGTAAGAVSQ